MKQIKRRAFYRTAGLNSRVMRNGYIGWVREEELPALPGERIDRFWLYSFRQGYSFQGYYPYNRKCIFDEFCVQNNYFEYFEFLESCFKGKDSCTILDLGANIGLFSLICAKRLKIPVKAHLFEPVTSNLEILSKNIDLNGLDAECIPKAVSNESDCEVDLFVYSTSGASINAQEIAELKKAAQGTERHVYTQKIQTITVDDYVKRANIETVDLLKIDVEGEEQNALEGARETVKRHRPVILCAYEHHANEKDRIISFIKELHPDYGLKFSRNFKILYLFPKGC